MNTPFISIIIPAYNGEKFLPRSIGSVLAQTYRNIELIVADDGSTDGTKKIVEAFCKTDSRVSYRYEENSGGPARPKNFAMQYAKGEYVAYLDQDDEWAPKKLEKQMALFAVNSAHSSAARTGKELGLVGCDAFLAHDNGKVFGRYKTPTIPAPFPALLDRNYIHSNSSVLLRREVIERVGARDEQLKYAEDWDMWIRIAAAGYRFAFVREPLFKYYFYPSNSTKKIGFIARAQESVRLYEKHLPLYEQYKQEGAALFNIGVRFCLGGDIKLSRTYFLRSLKKSPHNMPALAGLVLSRFGSLGREVMLIALEVSRFLHGRSVA
jgi:glycosyltransferase involved in cell wall biosynthesis